MHKARLWHPEKDASLLRCSLCAHRCRIPVGRTGICGVRENREGILYASSYGKVAAEAIDPIEKKPLYHFLPGTRTYSLGGVGCNFHCAHCQNWQISQGDLNSSYLRDISPEEGVSRALDAGCASVAWTYNEPTIWHEYTCDMGVLARKNNLKTVYVTNGYMTEDALIELAPMLSAFRVDIKSFSDDFYRRVCGARLQPVLDSAETARRLGMHIETVTLLIPGMNDSEKEIRDLSAWISDHLGPETPVHFTRFHPDYQMTHLPSTPVQRLERAAEIAEEEGLLYVYIGNVPGHYREDTRCANCGAILIERRHGVATVVHMEGTRCGVCNSRIPVVL